MKTRELIETLQELDPSGEAEIEVPVGSYTKVFPSAYLPIETVTKSPHYMGPDTPRDVRIWVSFPKGFRIQELKAKAEVK